jgi:hypothetical protein
MGRTAFGARQLVLAGLLSIALLVAASSGDVTASVFREPPDLDRTAEYLYPFGETFSFALSAPGQSAVLSIDLVPGTRVLIRFAKNTISAGCAKPLTASVVGPHGRVWSKTRLCTGRETIAFRATRDGLHYLTLDPPAARTGTIVVTLFLDQPEVEPGGPLFEDIVFINGSRSYGLSVAAAYRRGIARVWVREAGTTIASSSLCRSRCPVKRTLRATIDTRRLGEGTHEYAVEAVGSDGRSSAVETWRIFVDRTPPRPPRNFRVETYDPVRRTAAIDWDEGIDPDARDGTSGAGAYGYDYRLRREDGPWSPWRNTEAPALEVGGISPGSLIGLRVRENDGATNRSRIVETSLRVTGSEPPPEDPEA